MAETPGIVRTRGGGDPATGLPVRASAAPRWLPRLAALCGPTVTQDAGTRPVTLRAAPPRKSLVWWVWVYGGGAGGDTGRHAWAGAVPCACARLGALL